MKLASLTRFSLGLALSAIGVATARADLSASDLAALSKNVSKAVAKSKGAEVNEKNTGNADKVAELIKAAIANGASQAQIDDLVKSLVTEAAGTSGSALSTAAKDQIADIVAGVVAADPSGLTQVLTAAFTAAPAAAPDIAQAAATVLPTATDTIKSTAATVASSNTNLGINTDAVSAAAAIGAEFGNVVALTPGTGVIANVQTLQTIAHNAVSPN